MNSKDEEILKIVREKIQYFENLDSEPCEPRPQECCGQSCKPCVFDIHRNDLIRWAKDCARKMKFDDTTTIYFHIFGEDSIDPNVIRENFQLDEYLSFDVIQSENLTSDTKLFRFQNKSIKNMNMLPIGTHLRARWVFFCKKYALGEILKKKMNIKNTLF